VVPEMEIMTADISTNIIWCRSTEACKTYICV